MARFDATQLRLLSSKIIANDEIINRAASLAINKAVTFTKALSADEITNETNLQISYVKSKLRTAKRASPKSLFGIIRANTRNTLLTRYPTQETKDGVRVAINKKGGYTTIKRAFRVTNLRGSGSTGVAVSNIDAVAIFKKALNPATGAKSRKLQRIISKARTQPRGITVLNSRSINQLFTSVRVDVQPRTYRFMANEFIADVFRLQGAR